MISFGRHILNNFSVAIDKEWILTNKNGSYSSSTILMTNTRKHHGLLVAKFPEINNRIVIFPNFDEEVEIAGHIYNISTHQYEKTVYPRGYQYLESFTLKDDVVTFLYLIENIRIKKEIFLMKDSNTVLITYTLLTPDSYAKIHIRPFIAFKDTEQILKEITIFEPDITVEDKKIKIYMYKNLPPAYIYTPENSKIEANGVWYREFMYIKDKEDGNKELEDLYSIGKISFDLHYNETKPIILSTEELKEINFKKLKNKFHEQMKNIEKICYETGACVRDKNYRDFIQQLISAADSFVVKDKDDDMPVVIAGYHWPDQIWFRDTFASIPGLFLILKKFDEAKKILTYALSFERDGLLPLHMSLNKAEINYASIDTTLLFFVALYKYLKYTEDFDFIRKEGEVFKKLTWIIHKYSEGTNFGIKKDKDDLIYTNERNIPLSWMDTKIDGFPVVQRYGKMVEINALWYNAIKTMEFISKINNEKEMEKHYKDLADNIFNNFNKKFWNEEHGCLYDFIDGDYKNSDIRVNQIFALSLPFPLIVDDEKKEKVMNTVIHELYTSFGLRTLSNMDVKYKPKYAGTKIEKEKSAHDGTVWGFLLGPFVTAYIRTYGNTKENLKFLETVYAPIFEHLKTAGLGTISEMFDGSFPYLARGRISHAWAVAEILRSYFEDFLGINENIED